MGTRADFYVGKGKGAEWLGSIAYDGYPDGNTAEYLVNGASTEEEYRERVLAMIEALDHGTKPEQGWPWPWDDSSTSDYAYTWCGEDERVEVTDSAFPWWPAQNLHDHGGGEYEYGKAYKEGSVVFPDMTERKNVTLGQRSGMLVLSFQPSE